ncbi:Signal transduction histidine kinase [Lutibacter oricola]|uniref:histidine kinase n=1 Tax=Lutibacter oricola TaxID=762486 RepID=A0A1H2RPF3_9FLAO|nr:HAMP domain-containing sensor histidine kinase [Lutibacter oricola]SDW21227.1 Signal transduction histidine kinase [Lutibacter oricola]
MKKVEEIENYTLELEERLVELSLKVKNLTNKLNETQKSHTQLLNKLTHNLKNPIGISFSFSEMILENVENYDSEKLAKHIDVINSSSKYAIDLLNSFVKFNSVNNDTYSLNLEENNYSEFLNEILNKYSIKFNEENQNLFYQTEENLTLKFDQADLTFAFNQLLNNALQFSSENKMTSVITTTNSTHIITEITDQGVGITPENVPLVFNAFFVENTYTAKRKKCIGLGLTIAKKIIEFHKGTIKISSTPNKGTSVTVKLPL